jgi:hypothetical protein
MTPFHKTFPEIDILAGHSPSWNHSLFGLGAFSVAIPKEAEKSIRLK